MKVPVSMSKNLLTGEATFTYAEVTSIELTNVLLTIYNKERPGEYLPLLDEKLSGNS